MGSFANWLWGDKAKVGYLLFASILLIFSMLGAHEIWTQEHRWAEIVSGMFFRHDFLHPYLGNTDYYDKPLLSYWLIVVFSWLNQGLTEWTLRLPSALAGVLTIWSIYRLGVNIKDRQLGLLSGWMLLTTFYFVFWARTSSADMLNLAGSLFAISWYFEKRNDASFFDYAIFFLILAVTSLCKGLIGAIVPLIAVFIDMLIQKSWKQHLRASLFLAVIPALIVYLMPFMASSYFGSDAFAENGLYLVYRENILRYFKPFDHQGPIYTYFLYLPIYLLPWTIFFIPALFSLKKRWKVMSKDMKWNAWTLFALFLFFTLSGSRRSYYVLPLVPFAILLTADWVSSDKSVNARLSICSAIMIVISFVFLFTALDLMPKWYYGRYGVNKFAEALKSEASQIKPWSTWNVVTLDSESKLQFYLQLPPTAMNYHIKGDVRGNLPTKGQLLLLWPLLKSKPPNTIYVSRKFYVPVLQKILTNYRVFEIPYPDKPFSKINDLDVPVAFIPR